MNYETHVKETGRDPSAYPAIFTRFADTQIGHGAPIIRPHVSRALDYEGELAIIIGEPGRYISRETAMRHVAGYAPYNGYPATGVYEGYPYYGGYAGGIFVEQGDYGRGRRDHFRDDRGSGDNDRGFHGHPAPGFSHQGDRPGGFGGAVHGGGNFHGGGGGFFSHH